MKVLGIGARNVSFGRKPTKEESVQMRKDINEAKQFLGVEDQALILHGSCFPVKDNDLYIGSPFNEKAKEVNGFLKDFGFDSIQLGPSGALTERGNSPYDSSTTSENYLFSDMDKLTGESYGKILSKDDIKSVTDENYINTSNKTDFDKAKEVYNKLFDKAYTNLKTITTPETESLKKEFSEYKQKNDETLTSDAIYKIFEKKFNNSDCTEWPEDYQNLNLYKNDEKSAGHKKACEMFEKISKDNAEEIDTYKFKQFIINRQEQEFLKSTPDKLKYIADNTIGTSFQTYFAHPEAFLKDFRVGCPQGGAGSPVYGTERGANQFWNIPVLDPKKLFKKDGSLDIAGKILNDKLDKLLTTYQNVRIDHALGLVDAWIYRKDTVEIKKDASGNIYYSGAKGANISKMGKDNAFNICGCNEQQEQLRKINNEVKELPLVDPDGNYPKILEKIIMPLAEKHGIDPKKFVFEDLGSMTDTFADVFYKKLNMPGITNISWQRGQGTNSENYKLITSHDDDIFRHIATNQYYENNKSNAMNPDYLIGWLYPDKSPSEQAQFKEQLSWDTNLRVKTKFQELGRCAKKMQITFSDFFGTTNRYNVSGSFAENNWKARLTHDYQDKFYSSMEKQDWQAMPINIPEMYERAVISKGYTDEALANQRDSAIEKAKTIASKLNHWKEVLYEKTADIATSLTDTTVAKTQISENAQEVIETVAKPKSKLGKIIALAAIGLVVPPTLILSTKKAKESKATEKDVA